MLLNRFMHICISKCCMIFKIKMLIYLRFGFWFCAFLRNFINYSQILPISSNFSCSTEHFIKLNKRIIRVHLTSEALGIENFIFRLVSTFYTARAAIASYFRDRDLQFTSGTIKFNDIYNYFGKVFQYIH